MIFYKTSYYNGEVNCTEPSHQLVFLASVISKQVRRSVDELVLLTKFSKIHLHLHLHEKLDKHNANMAQYVPVEKLVCFALRKKLLM